MLRRLLLLVLITTFSPGLVGAPAYAQGGDATTTYTLNMRTGPGATYTVLVTLPGGTPLLLEARNADASWLLARTLDGAQRGWVASLYLAFSPGVSALRLPLSEEILSEPAPGAAPAPAPAGGEPAPEAPALAGGTATTRYQMNIRSGPGTLHNALGQLSAGTSLVLEARNGDVSWVLAHTPDNRARGWLASQYLIFAEGGAANLPISAEIVVAGVPTGAPAVEYAGERIIEMRPFNPASVTGINLAAYPVVGRATGRARQIFLTGRALGNNPNVVAKVGDCSSEHWYFLKPFAWGDYNLGGYSSLQPVVDYFGASLGYDSQATHNGFNANAVLMPMWADPAACLEDESPLECEFRLNRPSVAIIMFGTSDLLVMSPAQFNTFLRQIVEDSIDAGVIPILSTFPGNLGFWQETILYNQIVVRIALDYDIPLINLWLALEALPNHGLEPDGFHLGEPPYGTACVLTDPYLSTGYTSRNLITMQTLDAVWRGAMR